MIARGNGIRLPRWIQTPENLQRSSGPPASLSLRSLVNRRHAAGLGISIAIDGISLTIAAVDGDVIAVSLIPHTLDSTIAAGYRPRAIVNLEADVLAKYVARYLDESQYTPKRSTGVLKSAGGHKQTETA